MFARLTRCSSAALAAAALLLATAGALTARGDPPPERYRFFLGPSFEGLALSASHAAGDAATFSYGTCEPPPGEGGCAPPLQVQNWSICRRNPLEIDRLPHRILAIRGVPVIDYGDQLEILAGRADIVLFGSERRMRRAVAKLRPTVGPARLADSLPRVRLPRWGLRELKLVRVLRARGATRHALRRRLGISVSAIRLREQLAAAVGERALRVPAATALPGDVIADRHALATVEELGEGMATPEQRRRAERHRRRRAVC
jgi:hypothetical protein